MIQSLQASRAHKPKDRKQLDRLGRLLSANSEVVGFMGGDNSYNQREFFELIDKLSLGPAEKSELKMRA